MKLPPRSVVQYFMNDLKQFTGRSGGVIKALLSKCLGHADEAPLGHRQRAFQFCDTLTGDQLPADACEL
jgi:hypothetical protein